LSLATLILQLLENHQARILTFEQSPKGFGLANLWVMIYLLAKRGLVPTSKKTYKRIRCGYTAIVSLTLLDKEMTPIH
jgi:hypothetical protein